MKRSILLFLSVISALYADAHSNILGNQLSHEIRFMDDSKRPADQIYQAQLRNTPQWNQFLQQNGDWWVQFNETNGRPHRAFGKPVNTGIQAGPAATGLYFLTHQAAAWMPSGIQLEFLSATQTAKYVQANYIQKYNGLTVLWSRATVKLTADLTNAVMFGLDVYDDINISTQPAISNAQAAIAAQSGVTSPVTSVNVTNALRILPVPGYRSNDYHLVYEVIVNTVGDGVTPEKFYTLVDANNSTILYRSDKIESFLNADITATATVYPTHPYNPSAVVNLPYLQVSINGTIYNTDVNGFLSVTNQTAPYTANFALQGPYAIVYTGASGTTPPFFTATISPGSNTVSFDPNTSIRHLSAYYHANIVHDYMKTKFPSFTTLDFAMPVKVDRTDGNCNAFYDGNGINFYITANGCYALSMVSDVVYHEYGHSITNQFWGANGLSFDNGAMGEGYSDIWAISITDNPVLGIGFSDTDPASYVRNYDFANGNPRKVYPQNIIGEVHADGEIIAGAWWSTSLLTGSLSLMSDIFAESHAGLANGPNGAEGQVYTDILIDALFADDNDANLSNGTPNGSAITQAFALHGITLLSNATLSHTPVATAAGNTAITLNASLNNITFAWALSGVKGYYKINNSTVWNPLSFTSGGGTNYTANIPGQPDGTLISYYVGIEDINGALSNVLPAGANGSNPNLPYFILVGFTKIFTEDFDLFGGLWQEVAPGDNATTGTWQQYIPDQTIVNNAVVQPNYQVTPGGLICYVTGGQGGSQAGDYDVDNGKTTLTSPVFDLTSYTNPTIEYYRWYTNDQGATPGTDFWQVLISNDGVNYIPIENTSISDHSWRNNVFRINDYLPSTSTFTIRFIAEDANAGSLVEALMDDMSLYDGPSTTALQENSGLTMLTAWPVPAGDQVNFTAVNRIQENFQLQITDAMGKIVFVQPLSLDPGKNQFSIPVKSMANGIYLLQLTSESGTKSIRFSVSH